MGAVLIGRTFEEGVRDYLKLAELLDLRSVELDFSHPALCFDGLKARVYLTELNSDKKKLIREFISDFKIKGAHLPFASMSVYSASANLKVQEASRRLMKFGIEQAAELELDFVTMHLDTQGLSGEEKWRRVREAILEYFEVAKLYNVILAFENTFDNLMELPALIREANSPLIRLTLDTGHAFMVFKNKPNKNIVKYIEENGELIYNIHVHDSTRKRDHLMVGRGVIDFKSIIKTLKKIEYRYSLNLESEPESPQTAIEETIESIRLLKSYED